MSAGLARGLGWGKVLLGVAVSQWWWVQEGEHAEGSTRLRPGFVQG